MNHPDPDADSRAQAVADLRDRFLADLDGDVWPMAHLDSLITRSHLTNTATERHTLALDLITTLLEDGTILVGDVHGGDPAYIEPWPGTPHDTLTRIRTRYVDNYADTYGWDLCIWFSLNDPQRLFHPNTTTGTAVENTGK